MEMRGLFQKMDGDAGRLFADAPGEVESVIVLCS